MTRAVALLAALAFLPVARAADPDPKSLVVPAATAARAAELVAHLSDRAYADRDAATKELRKLGRLALPALRDALAHSTNAETRLRLDLLLPAAVSADLRARVECFLADTDGKFQHDLPGAKAFFAAAGRTDAAKQLFADVMRSVNRELVVAVEGPEADLQQLYLARRAELGFPAANNGAMVLGGRISTTLTLPATDLAALLFVESRLPQKQPVAARTQPLMSNYNFQTALRNTLTQGTHKDALDALVTHWVDSRETATDIQTALNYMNRFNLPNGLPAARKLLSQKPAVEITSPFQKAFACTYVARYGTADDLPLLEALHADKGVVTTMFVGGPNNRKQVIQMRDVALAMSLLRAGQNPTDYGMINRYAGSGAVDSLKYNYYTFYFDADTDEEVDGKRKDGVAKYAEWKEKQKKEKK